MGVYVPNHPNRPWAPARAKRRRFSLGSVGYIFAQIWTDWPCLLYKNCVETKVIGGDIFVTQIPVEHCSPSQILPVEMVTSGPVCIRTVISRWPTGGDGGFLTMVKPCDWHVTICDLHSRTCDRGCPLLRENALFARHRPASSSPPANYFWTLVLATRYV